MKQSYGRVRDGKRLQRAETIRRRTERRIKYGTGGVES